VSGQSVPRAWEAYKFNQFEQPKGVRFGTHLCESPQDRYEETTKHHHNAARGSSTILTVLAQIPYEGVVALRLAALTRTIFAGFFPHKNNIL